MLGESRLNVYVLDADITPRLRERIQAQIQTAIRELPSWTFALLTRRMNELGSSGMTLIIESAREPPPVRPLSLGDIEGRPAACLRPTVAENHIDWGQDPRYLVAKAVGYLASPASDGSFWKDWTAAIEKDGLRARAAATSALWEDETDMGLFIEMFAAYALRDGDDRWSELSAVHAFLRSWRSDIA